MIRIYLVLVFASALVWYGCSSSGETKNMTAQERFNHGKKLFDDEDYLEAKKDFDQIKLQFPGTTVANDAQYFLAECYFKREEYLLAIEEYQSIKRSQQGSPYLQLAQFRIAMAYYNLSPESHLDQEYSVKAIDAFQTYIEYYPTSDSVAPATAKIQELNNRLARKDFDSGDLYMKLGYYKAAIYYYNSVTEKFHDTPFAEPAHFSLAKALAARKQYTEAKKELSKFLEKYPQTKFKQDADALMNDLTQKLQTGALSDSTHQNLQTIR